MTHPYVMEMCLKCVNLRHIYYTRQIKKQGIQIRYQDHTVTEHLVETSLTGTGEIPDILLSLYINLCHYEFM